MQNELKRKVLEDRLQILDVLESLVAQAPDREHYDELLSDFRVGASPDSMKAQLEELSRNNIATFILPSSRNARNFWDSVVRVKDIDLPKLQAMRQSIHDELDAAMRKEPVESGVDVATGAGEEESRPVKAGSTQSAESTSGGVALFGWVIGLIAAVVGIAVPISTWSVLRTDLARALVILGIVVLVMVSVRLCLSFRLYLSFKTEKLSRRAAIDLVGVGALFAIGAIILVNVFGSSRSDASSPLPRLRFVPVQLVQPQECEVYDGTGTIPKGYYLLIFDSPSPNGQYYWDGIAMNQKSGGWQTPVVMAGNDPTYISAILVTASVYKFVESIMPVPAKQDGKYNSWISLSLPQSLQPIPSLTVLPPKNNSGC